MNADKKGVQKGKFGTKETKQKNLGKNKQGIQSGNKGNLPNSTLSRDM